MRNAIKFSVIYNQVMFSVIYYGDVGRTKAH